MKQQPAISLYWKCQLMGWSVAALYWGYAGYSNGHCFNWLLAGLQFITDVALYILVTHLYRCFALSRGWQNLGLNKLLPRLIPAVIILGLVYLLVTVVKVYFFRVWFQGFTQPFVAFFDFNRDIILVAGVRLMSIWLLAYHMYHYSKREICIAKENARLAVITRDAQLNNLSAQLNPHFLFNSLNNIKALIIDDPKSARRAIDLLAELLRSSLYSGDKQLVTIKDELELVKDYLELEKLRLEERLQYHITTGDEMESIQLPRLSIQTLVENAIKHGISDQKLGGLVNIKLVKDAAFLTISISNPGKLKPVEENTGLGLKNLSERLQLQYKGSAAFGIFGADGMVMATIKIPLV